MSGNLNHHAATWFFHIFLSNVSIWNQRFVCRWRVPGRSATAYLPDTPGGVVTVANVPLRECDFLTFNQQKLAVFDISIAENQKAVCSSCGFTLPTYQNLVINMLLVKGLQKECLTTRPNWVSWLTVWLTFMFWWHGTTSPKSSMESS